MLKCGNFTLSFYRGDERSLQKTHSTRSTLFKLFNQVFCGYSLSSNGHPSGLEVFWLVNLPALGVSFNDFFQFH